MKITEIRNDDGVFKDVDGSGHNHNSFFCRKWETGTIKTIIHKIWQI
jgi:hypothetical protein